MCSVDVDARSVSVGDEVVHFTLSICNPITLINCLVVAFTNLVGVLGVCGSSRLQSAHAKRYGCSETSLKLNWTKRTDLIQFDTLNPNKE